MKTLGKFVVILVCVVVLLSIGKDIFIKTAIEYGGGILTGLRISMDSLSVSMAKTFVSIKGLKVYNPASFKESLMLDLPEMTIDYNLTDILKGTIHVERVVLNLQTFNVVKNADGVVNLDSLKIAKEGQKKEKPEAEKPAPKKKAMPFQLDNLSLKIGKVSFIDYTKGEPPQVNEFRFDLDENYTNITHPQIVVAIILQKAFLKASLAKFDLGGLEGAVGNVVGDVSNLAKGVVSSAATVASGVLDTAKELPGAEGVKQIGSKAEDTAKEAVSALKGLASKLKK